VYVSVVTRHLCLYSTHRDSDIKFKLAVLVYNVLNGLDCQIITITGCYWLRSFNVAMCELSRTWTSLGDRSFAVVGLCVWNNLPIYLRDSELSLLVPPVAEDAPVCPVPAQTVW